MVLSVTPKNHNQKQTEKVGINSLGFALMSRTIWQIAEKQRKTNSKDSYRNRNSWHNQNEQLSVWNWKNNDRNNKISKNWQEKSKWKKKKDWKRKHQKWTKSLKNLSPWLKTNLLNDELNYHRNQWLQFFFIEKWGRLYLFF